MSPHANRDARLAAMDRDGVEAEVLYSELSAFRQFHLIPDDWKEVARAFNDCMSDFAGVDASESSHRPGVVEAARRYRGEELEAMLTGLFEADLAIKTNVMGEEPALAAWVGEHLLAPRRS
jgi:DNA polymerase III delta subunit